MSADHFGLGLIIGLVVILLLLLVFAWLGNNKCPEPPQLTYETKSMKKTMERRLLFIEITLCKINVSIQSLENMIRQNLENMIRQNKINFSNVMIWHGADPNLRSEAK